MGQNKVRVGGSKGQRWAKGQSSNSNPSKNKHRTQAKSRFFNYGTTDGDSKLTSAALLRHDAVQGGLSKADLEQGDEDVTKVTHKTFDTFASDWSGCTNVAFDKVISKFKANNAGHKDMLAVLAAVTEVIKQEGGKETETEYFAALMTTLEVTKDEDCLSAVVRLLSLVIKKVAHPVLISKFSQVNSLLVSTLSQHADGANVSLLRGIVGCIAVLLRVQPVSIWTLPEAEHSFQVLLSYTAHTKPKLRKAGQHAIVSIVRGSSPDIVSHPAAPIAAKHCQAVIAKCGPTDTAVLYMLTLLRDILPALPRSETQSSCETVLKLLTLGSSVLVSTGFGALYGLFSGRPSVSCLPAEMNARLVNALYDFQPGVNDERPLIAWLAVQQEGLLNLAQQDSTMVDGHVTRFTQVSLQCLLSDRGEVVKAAGLALRAVLSEVGSNLSVGVAGKVMAVLGEAMNYQYHTAWPTVLGILQTAMEVVGSTHPEHIKPVLSSLAQLRGSHNFSLEGEVDNVVGKAVQSAGPKLVLSAIPLNITGKETDYEFRSSWLLPVLRDNIRNTQLAFFVEYFLPLAATCLDRSNACAAQKDAIGQKSYAVLTYQMWALLPGFCINPTDLATSFKGLARILGVQLDQRKELRLDILTGLRHLISRNLEHSENRAELARYAKNYLPILFNLYTAVPAGSEEAGQRLAAMETVKLYFQIADTALLQTMFDKALEKYKTETVQFTKDAIMDLLRSLIPYIDISRVSILFTETMSGMTSKDHKEQKKSYRLLEELCRGPSEATKEFLVTALPELQTSLLSSLSAASPSSQAPRLRCLISILGQLEEPNQTFALALIPEAVLSIRAVNSKARKAAFTLLVGVGEALQRWSQADNSMDQVITQYMSCLLAGLAGNPGLIHCTVLAVSRIYFQFRDIFPDNLIDQVLNNILLLLSSSSREVAGAALSFIKVFVTSTPLLAASKFVPEIVSALVTMPEDCKRHFRVKTKFLLERLTRKFGWDFVSSLVPKSDINMHKRLRNMRKELARRARTVSEDSGNDEDDLSLGMKKKQQTMEEILADSSDDDLEEEPSTGKKEKRTKKASKTWIKETGDEVVDLLSSTAAQSISSTNPKAPKSLAEKPAKKKEAFKINSDGKLIINDEPSDDEDNPKRSARYLANAAEDSDSEGEETFESMVSGKRRKISSEAGSQKSMMSGISSKCSFSKYAPSGSGIHRKLDKGAGSEYRSKTGKGDVKRPGKHDPYAYIPMTHKALNKRKQAKAKGQFSSVISAAKKGAKRGHNNKVKEVKSLMKKMKM